MRRRRGLRHVGAVAILVSILGCTTAASPADNPEPAPLKRLRTCLCQAPRCASTTRVSTPLTGVFISPPRTPISTALLFVRSTDSLSLFDKPRRDGFAMLFLNLHHYGDLANEIFGGLWLLPLALLVYKLLFLPRFLGAWLMIACFGSLASSFTGFLLPAYEDKVINSPNLSCWRRSQSCNG